MRCSKHDTKLNEAIFALREGEVIKVSLHMDFFQDFFIRKAWWVPRLLQGWNEPFQLIACHFFFSKVPTGVHGAVFDEAAQWHVAAFPPFIHVSEMDKKWQGEKHTAGTLLGIDGFPGLADVTKRPGSNSRVTDKTIDSQELHALNAFQEIINKGYLMTPWPQMKLHVKLPC